MLVVAIAPLQLLVAVTAKGLVPLICTLGGGHVGAPACGVTVILSAWLAINPVASVTSTKNPNVPAAFGVPEIPPDALKLNPGGKAKMPGANDHALRRSSSAGLHRRRVQHPDHSGWQTGGRDGRRPQNTSGDVDN